MTEERVEIVFTTRLPKAGFARLEGRGSVDFRTCEGELPWSDGTELRNNGGTEIRNNGGTELRSCEGAEILVSTFDYKVTAEMMRRMPRLKLVANFGVGYNNIDLSYCREHGILVTNTPRTVTEPTAEHCFALMHAIAHRTAELDRRLRTEHVTFGVMHNLGVSLYGKQLGIVGMGRIGQSVARRAVAAGMHIAYHNRHRLPEATERLYGARYLSLDELLGTSDYVSLNLPYTPEVHHLIDAAALRKMKPTAILINTARGAHVDEAALAEALQNGTIAGAALDVFEHEPEITPALLGLDNVVMSPHIGTGTIDGRTDMCHEVEDNILAFLDGRQEEMNIVN